MRSRVLAFEGEFGVELHCGVSGKPKPEVEWYFKGEKLLDNLFYRTSDNGSLLIIIMRPQLAGNYTCRAQNIVGNNSETIRLNYGGR